MRDKKMKKFTSMREQTTKKKPLREQRAYVNCRYLTRHLQHPCHIQRQVHQSVLHQRLDGLMGTRTLLLYFSSHNHVS